jgi:hypothetical protein
MSQNDSEPAGLVRVVVVRQGAPADPYWAVPPFRLSVTVYYSLRVPYNPGALRSSNCTGHTTVGQVRYIKFEIAALRWETRRAPS